MTDRLAITPEAEQLFNRALELHQAGDLRAAAVAYQDCTTIAPGLDLAWGNLGRCLASLGLHREAIVAYTKAFTLSPHDAEFLPHAAMSFRALGETENARGTIVQALAVDPHHLNALAAMGVIETEAGNYAAAKECLSKALALCPADASGDRFRSLIWNNLGSVAYRGDRDLASAAEAYHKAISLDPQNGDALNNYATILVDLGQAKESIEFFTRALRAGGSLTVQSNFVMALLYGDTYSPAQMRAEHEAWGSRLMELVQRQMGSLPPPPQHAPWTTPTQPRRPIRVGYLTADFRAHTTSQFLLPVLSRHTPQIELFLYANFADPDAITRKFMERANHVHFVVHLSDGELNDLIRRDQLDILVECSGHTEGHRLATLALKPAPIICSWVGYPATTGVPTVDYRIVDKWTDPAGYDSHCSEKLIRLESGFNCFQPHLELPAISPLPAIANRHITFGSANNVRKISDETLRMWGEILRATPTARLRIKSIHLDTPRARERIQSRLAEYGVGSDRLDFIGFVVGQHEHLHFYNSVDIALDTVPYNGTTTTCDALSMGVPVIALRGDSHVSRVSYSILERVGLGHLVAKDAREYVALASSLASQLELLCSLREATRSMFITSPLAQYERFVAELETAYLKMCGL